MEPTKQELENMTDHDLLIRHSGKIDSLCALMRTNNKHLKEFNDALVDRCTLNHTGITETHKEIFNKIDKKMDAGTFRWIVGTAVLLAICVAGLVGPNLAYIPANKKAIQQLEISICDIKDKGVYYYGVPPRQ